MTTSLSDACAKAMVERMSNFLELLSRTIVFEYPWLPDPPHFVSPLEEHNPADWHDGGIQGKIAHYLPSSLVYPHSGAQLGPAHVGWGPGRWGKIWQSEMFDPYWTGRLAVIEGPCTYDHKMWRLMTTTELVCVFAQHPDPGCLSTPTSACCGEEGFRQVYMKPYHSEIILDNVTDSTHNVLLARTGFKQYIAKDPIECDFGD
jgi:hypothetical protein